MAIWTFIGMPRRSLEFSRQKPRYPDLVTVTKLMGVVNKIFSSSYVAAIKNVLVLEQGFPGALMAVVYRSGLEGVTVNMWLCAETRCWLYTAV